MRRSALISGGPPGAPVAASAAVATPALAGPQPGYEAETASNVLSGSARVDACKPCSGETRVGGVGRTGRLTFRGVKADEAGAATVAIAYSSVDQRSAWLQVNRGRTLRLAFPATGSPDTTATLTVRLNLQAGDNTLTFSNPFASAPDFDRLDVGGAGSAMPTETVSDPRPTAPTPAPTGSAPTSRPPVATNAPTESDQFAAQ